LATIDNYDETARLIITEFEDVLLPIEGDNYALTYRLKPDLYMPSVWCRLDWIIDIQLKKLCDEALLEKEKARRSFKYDDYWWTVTHDQMTGTKVFRYTESFRKMFYEPINDHIPKIPQPAMFADPDFSHPS
jgi:hypothetical protein